MRQTLKKLMLTLAAVAVFTAGAWAQNEQSEAFTVTSGTSYSGSHFSVTGTVYDMDGLYLYSSGSSPQTVTVASLNGENITRVTFHFSYGKGYAECVTTTEGTLACTNGNADGAINVINATSLDISTNASCGIFGVVQINQITVYYNDAPAPAPAAVAVTSNANGTYNLTMPAQNLLLNVDWKTAPELAWTYNSQSMPAEGLTAYLGFADPILAAVNWAAGEDFYTAFQTDPTILTLV